jgi:hypothetical protein
MSIKGKGLNYARAMDESPEEEGLSSEWHQNQRELREARYQAARQRRFDAIINS